MLPTVRARRSTAALVTIATFLLLLSALIRPVSAANPTPRIINGHPAAFGAYPFMAALLLTDVSGSDFDRQYCGGSLIAPRWVLTAAHCADFLTGPSEVAVAVGRSDLDSTQGVRIAIRSIHIHPDWDPKKLSPDVALLELATPVTTITPIQLATGANNNFEAAGTPLTVIGWGNLDTRNGHATFPDALHEVVVPAVTDTACAKIYHKFLVQATMLCAGAPGLDSCQGDSGGPIFATTATGVRIQMGIVSWGQGCAKNHFVGVYGEVNSPTIRTFIQQTAGV